jgi:hypothetical protein
MASRSHVRIGVTIADPRSRPAPAGAALRARGGGAGYGNGGVFAENQDLHAAHTTHASHAHNGPIQIKARAATQGVESGRRTPTVRLRAAPETARPRSVRRAGQL